MKLVVGFFLGGVAVYFFLRHVVKKDMEKWW